MPNTEKTIVIPFIDTCSKTKPDTVVSPYLTFQHHLTADTAKQEIIYRKSLFTYHKLPKISREAVPIPAQHPNGWIFCLLIAIVFLFGFLTKNHSPKLKEILRSCFSNRYLNFLLKDTISLKRTLIPLIYIGFQLIITLFIYHLIIFTKSPFPLPNASIYINFIILLVITNLFLLLRILIINFLGNVFMSKKSTDIFLINDFNFTFLISLVLLPILFLAFFSDSLAMENATKIGIGIVSLLYIIKILRSLNITLLYNRLSKLYLFYYLCSLEIIPILVIGKILISF